eukprot:PhM_4_TR17006/c0_g1_i1/m.42419
MSENDPKESPPVSDDDDVIIVRQHTAVGSASPRDSPPPYDGPAPDVIPYDALPEVGTTDKPLGREIRVFMGGLRYDADQVRAARIASYLSGINVPLDNVVVFARDPERRRGNDSKGISATRFSGSAIVHMPANEATDRLMSYHKRVLCEDNALSILPEATDMAAYAKARGGGPHPLVVEQAKHSSATKTSDSKRSGNKGAGRHNHNGRGKSNNNNNNGSSAVSSPYPMGMNMFMMPQTAPMAYGYPGQMGMPFMPSQGSAQTMYMPMADGSGGVQMVPVMMMPPQQQVQQPIFMQMPTTQTGGQQSPVPQAVNVINGGVFPGSATGGHFVVFNSNAQNVHQLAAAATTGAGTSTSNTVGDVSTTAEESS